MLSRRLTCNVQSNSIYGVVGGRSLHCDMAISQLGHLPMGKYQILPPQNDLMFGTIALVVPAGGRLTKDVDKSSRVAGKAGWDYGPVAGKAGWDYGPVAEKLPFDLPTAGTAVFVLSDRPIPGRNSIIVRSGFADLMDALQISSGGELVVL